jgi:hypothetical protein
MDFDEQYKVKIDFEDEEVSQNLIDAAKMFQDAARSMEKASMTAQRNSQRVGAAAEEGALAGLTSLGSGLGRGAALPLRLYFGGLMKISRGATNIGAHAGQAIGGALGAGTVMGARGLAAGARGLYGLAKPGLAQAAIYGNAARIAAPRVSNLLMQHAMGSSAKIYDNVISRLKHFSDLD